MQPAEENYPFEIAFIPDTRSQFSIIHIFFFFFFSSKRTPNYSLDYPSVLVSLGLSMYYFSFLLYVAATLSLLLLASPIHRPAQKFICTLIEFVIRLWVFVSKLKQNQIFPRCKRTALTRTCRPQASRLREIIQIIRLIYDCTEELLVYSLPAKRFALRATIPIVKGRTCFDAIPVLYFTLIAYYYYYAFYVILINRINSIRRDRR